jgi:hypothetical protein
MIRRRFCFLLLVVVTACGANPAVEQANTWTCSDYWNNIEERQAVATELLTRGWLSIDDSSALPGDELAQKFTVALVNRCGARVEAGRGDVKLSDEAADVYVNSGTTFRP